MPAPPVERAAGPSVIPISVESYRDVSRAHAHRCEPAKATRGEPGHNRW